MGRYTFLVTIDGNKSKKSVNEKSLAEAKHLINVMYPQAESIILLS